MNIRKVGVLDAGPMGHGIAQAAARAGYDVALRELLAASSCGRRSRLGFYDYSGDAPVENTGI